MKVIKERKELAQAINFGRHPVVKIVCKPRNGYNDIIDGGRVKVITGKMSNGGDCIEVADITIFRDLYGDGRKHVNIGSAGMGITASFCVADLVRMADNANLPIIEKSDEVVFVLVNEEATAAAVVMAEVQMTIKYCQTSAKLEDGASEKIAELAWKIADNH